jgi:hypothetical protein
MALFMDVHHKVEGLTAEAVAAVHREAHGLVADEIVPVQQGVEVRSATQ